MTLYLTLDQLLALAQAWTLCPELFDMERVKGLTIVIV